MAVAQAFGLPARRVAEPGEVADAIGWCLATPGPCLLHVAIASEENVWPTVLPGKANEEMMTGRIA